MVRKLLNSVCHIARTPVPNWRGAIIKNILGETFSREIMGVPRNLLSCLQLEKLSIGIINLHHNLNLLAVNYSEIPCI